MRPGGLRSRRGLAALPVRGARGVGADDALAALGVRALRGQEAGAVEVLEKNREGESELAGRR